MSNKRNKRQVIDNRWDKKRETGRIVNDKFQEVKPPITAKTEAQKELFKAMRCGIGIAVIGPAGVGKTYVAAGNAADKLMKGEIDKICVSRPYVGMGKGMGFRPGSEFDKLLPYVLPIFDVFKKRMGRGALDSHISNENIELVPLETLRGRSFENAIVLIDECQNVTPKEMESIVTRIGQDCQLIMMGDLNPMQRDIQGESGLEWFCDMVEKYNIDGGEIVEFTIDDCVRSSFCHQFLRAIDDEGYSS